MTELVHQKADQAYKLYQKYEVARYKIYRHTGVTDPNLVNTAPGTRASESIYTVKIQAECTVCNGRHTELGHRSYLQHFAFLPFVCSCSNPITGLTIEDPEDRTLPPIFLPANIRRLAPASMTTTSLGEVEDETLEQDISRIEEAQRAAAAAFVDLGATVMRTGFDYSRNPQLSPEYITNLNVLMTQNLNHCVGMVRDFQQLRDRDADVEEEVNGGAEGSLQDQNTVQPTNPENPEGGAGNLISLEENQTGGDTVTVETSGGGNQETSTGGEQNGGSPQSDVAQTTEDNPQPVVP